MRVGGGSTPAWMVSCLRMSRFPSRDNRDGDWIEAEGKERGRETETCPREALLTLLDELSDIPCGSAITGERPGNSRGIDGIVKVTFFLFLRRALTPMNCSHLPTTSPVFCTRLQRGPPIIQCTARGPCPAGLLFETLSSSLITLETESKVVHHCGREGWRMDP